MAPAVSVALDPKFGMNYLTLPDTGQPFLLSKATSTPTFSHFFKLHCWNIALHLSFLPDHNFFFNVPTPPPPSHTHTHISHWVCAGVPLLLLSKDLVQVLAPALQNEHRHQHCMYILEKEMTRSAKLQLNGNDDRFYITLFSALEHSLHSLSHVILNEWLLLFVVFFFFK